MAVKLLSNISAVTKTAGNKSYLGKSITETITNGFFTVDHKWTVKYWNKAAEKLLRVQAKDIVGKNLWEEFAELIPLNFYAVYHKAFLQDIPLHFEEYWGEMGTWFDVITYHCDDTLSVSFKTTQPVRPEQPQQQLKMLNELYRFVTEVTNDCLWEWDLTTMEIFWIDGGHKRVFGYQIENALIPQSFWESRLHPDDRIRVLTRLKKIINAGSGNLWEEEYRFEKADGNYAYVHDRGHIFYNDEKVACRMIGATQDITAKKLTEIKLLEERRSRHKKITNAVLTAQENERAEIGKELHDNLNQILGATKLYIEMAKTDEVNRQMCLEKSSEYIVNVIEEIRKISKTLVAPGLALIGLVDSIKNLLGPGGVYISSELGWMAQNLFLPLITPMIGNKKVIFPIPNDCKRGVLFIKKLIEEGKFKAVIDRKYSLEKIAEAYRYVEKGEKTGNVVITLEDNY